MSFFSKSGTSKPDPNEVVRQLHLEHSRFMFKFLMKKHAKPEIAEEIIQEVFMNLYENFYSIKDIGAIKGWLITAAFNKYKNYLDKRSTQSEEGITYIDSEGDYEDGDEEESNQSWADQDVGTSEVIDTVDCFKKKFKLFQKSNSEAALVIEMDMDDMSGREMALAINRTEAATRTFLKESKKKLKPLLEECR
jgi:RNA polymerase sigma factor (sigma-70 family)